MWGNEGTSDLSMFAAYRDQTYLPVGLDMNGPSAEPGLSRIVRVAPRRALPSPRPLGVASEGGARVFPVLAAVLPKWINGFAGAEDANGAAAPRRVETRRVLSVSGYARP